MTGMCWRAAALAWLGGLALAAGAVVQGGQWGTPAVTAFVYKYDLAPNEEQVGRHDVVGEDEVSW
ncbi:hypothetical protein [Oceanithermus sp.]|uniref:hypothetical protein n=1 Tax=Oceanithermus sp. TaxID=2268145 RepID=UPI002580E1E8|nr:hypothetical protein [Oceanithermus sp.]